MTGSRSGQSDAQPLGGVCREVGRVGARAHGEMIALEKQLVVVDAELAKLQENQERVQRLRYVDGLSWSYVAKRMNYCERYCTTLGELLIIKIANGVVVSEKK